MAQERGRSGGRDGEVTVLIAHTGWQVTSIDPSAYTVDAKGDPMYGTRVRFTTGAGNQGTVWLPDNALSPANVAELINLRAAMLDQVGALSSPPMGVVG